MKKSFILLTAIVSLLSGCSSEINTPLISDSSTEIYSISKNSPANKQEINSIAENIYLKNYADGVNGIDSIKNADNLLQLIPALKEKGPEFFKLLNSDVNLQNQYYPLTDDKVGSFLTKPSKPDNTPPITPDETKQLLASLKPGDLILCGNDDSFIHAILYTGNNTIIHSLASKGKGNNRFLGVIKESLTEYLERSERDKFVVLRYKKLNSSDLQKSVSYASKQIGKSYDTLFLMYSNTRFYCTELVFQSIMSMSNPPQVYPHKTEFGWELIRNEDFMDSPDFNTVWSLHYTRPQTGKLNNYK